MYVWCSGGWLLGVQASDTRLAAPESARSRTGGLHGPRHGDQQPLEGAVDAVGAVGAVGSKESNLLVMLGSCRRQALGRPSVQPGPALRHRGGLRQASSVMGMMD